ncbi:MAG: septum formation initiator family protein [Gemmatimonadales bacterium]
MSPRRWLLVAALAAAVTFAFCGGEYGTLDLLQLKRDSAAERIRIAELERVVDSLDERAKAVESDLETQERIARERHGMLKPGEHAFILERVGETNP